MHKISINEYLELLNFSKKEIEKYYRLYNKNLNNKTYKLKLRYNLFSYTQLNYGLKEFLINNLPKNPQVNLINNFFTKNNEIIKIANYWKHSGIHSHQSFILHESGDTADKVEIKTKLHNPKDYINLIDEIKIHHKNLINFMEKYN